MNKQWVVLVLLVLGTNFACAASFDCSKASTKVEKMICADPGLSKLDEELGKAYAKARDVSSKPDKLKQQQRDWMKERNKRVDSQCLSRKYEARIAELGKNVVSSNIPVANDGMAYPPYTDVWGYELPYPSENDRNAIQNNYLSQSGGLDVLYATKIVKVGSLYSFSYALLDFFSGVITKFSSSDMMNKYSAEHRSERLSSITHVMAKFSDGASVSREGYSHNCYINLPFRLVVKDKDGKVLARKYLLYLRDAPRVQSVTPYCENAQGESSFDVHVESVFGTIVMLKDDTFILSESGGNLVLRMDKQLKTKYKNEHLYIVDAAVVDEIKRKLQEEERFNHQSFDDAVVEYLKNFDKGEW